MFIYVFYNRLILQPPKVEFAKSGNLVIIGCRECNVKHCLQDQKVRSKVGKKTTTSSAPAQTKSKALVDSSDVRMQFLW